MVLSPSIGKGDASPAERAPATDTEEKSLVSSMYKKLNALPKNLNTSNRPTIFRIPANLRKSKENLIEPSVVSIGPYHHDDKHIKPMEEIKWLLLQNILSGDNTKITLAELIEKIKSVLLRTRSCYSECVKMDDDSFTEMLILDGTFIVQFMSKPLVWFKRETGWTFTFIATDLILLENQIPFFIVQILWDVYFGLPINPADLKKFTEQLVSNELIHSTTPPKKIDHLLHLCQHYVVPDMSGHETVLPGCTDSELCTALSVNSFLSCTSPGYKKPSEYIIPCATELKEAGIKFRKKRSPCKMMEVTFNGGTIEIPFIKIDDDLKPLIFNILALEQSDFFPNHLTSYVYFMDSLINTDHDVAILQRHGIIENMLSSEEEVAQFFNQLGQHTILYTGHYLSDLFQKVNQQYNSKCGRYRAKLMRNYFSSPWSILSLSGVFILLGLSSAQTYFAGYAYFLPSQSPN